jgi:hypothetical protein
MLRGKTLLCGLLAAGIGLLAGCHHEKYKVKAKIPEDYVIPPNDARFDEAPEEDWRRPQGKKKDAPGSQNGMMPGGGMGNSQFGGRR